MAYNDKNAFINDLKILRATQDESRYIRIYFGDNGREGLDSSSVYGENVSNIFVSTVDFDDPKDNFGSAFVFSGVDRSGKKVTEPDKAAYYTGTTFAKARKLRVYYNDSYVPGDSRVDYNTYIDAEIKQVGNPGNPLDPADPADPLPTPEPAHINWKIIRAWRNIHGDLLAQVDVVPECGIVRMNGMHPGTAGRWWKVGAEGGAKDCGDGIYMLEIGYTWTLNAGPCRTLLLEDGHGNVERLDIDDNQVPDGPNFVDRVGIPDTEDTPPDWRNHFENEGDWPAICYIHQSRLGYASSANMPLTVWLSQTGMFESMASSVPPRADDAIEATIAAQAVDRIVWAVSDRGRLALGLGNSEWVLSGSDDGPVAPTSVMFQRQTQNGSQTYLPALLTNNGIVYVQNGGDAVREYGYSFQSDSYRSDDLSVLARHMLAENPVVAWAYQREPFGIVWCATVNGVVAGLTLLKEQEVIAWHRHWFAGAVRDIAALGDDIFLVVDHNDGTRSLQRLAPWFVNAEDGKSRSNDPADAIHLDSARVIDTEDFQPPILLKGRVDEDGNTVAATFEDEPWNGLAGAQCPGRRASWTDGGSGGGRRSVVGTPFISTIVPTRPETQLQNGTTMGLLRKVNAVKCKVYRTCPFTAFVGSSEPMRVGRGGTQWKPNYATAPGGGAAKFCGVWIPEGLWHPVHTSATRTGSRTTTIQRNGVPGYAADVELWAVPLGAGWRDDEDLVLTFTGPEPATILAVIQTIETSQFNGRR